MKKTQSIGGIEIPLTTMIGPGPVDQLPEVLSTAGLEITGHHHSSFVKVRNKILDYLRILFECNYEMVRVIDAGGSGAIRTLIANTVVPGTQVVVVNTGFFGNMICDNITHCGGISVEVKPPSWGEPVAAQDVAEAVEKSKANIVWIEHGETSLGLLSDLRPLVKAIRNINGDCLVFVDAVTTAGGVPLRTRELELDGIASAAQKALGADPGLGMIAISPRALAYINSLRDQITDPYFALHKLDNYWRNGKFHHTTPVRLYYILLEALFQVLDPQGHIGGLENLWSHHEMLGNACTAGADAAGLKYVVNDVGNRIPYLHCWILPQGITPSTVVSELAKHGIEIAGGLPPRTEGIIRMSTMGPARTIDHITQFWNKLDSILRDCPGYTPGVAAHEVEMAFNSALSNSPTFIIY